MPAGSSNFTGAPKPSASAKDTFSLRSTVLYQSASFLPAKVAITAIQVGTCIESILALPLRWAIENKVSVGDMKPIGYLSSANFNSDAVMAVVVDHECSSGECGIFRDPVARITGRASASGYNVYSASVYRLEHQLQGHVLRILRGHNHTEYHTNPHMVFVLLSTWGFACVVEFVKQVLKEKQRFCLRFLLVKIIGVCCHPLCYAIILEFIDGGDLYKLLPSRKNPDPYLDKWSNRLDMARQTADGMQHLHSLQPPIIHRDLTPKNILVEKASLKYLCKVSKMHLTSIHIKFLVSATFA